MASPLSPEISPSLFIFDGATNFRELAYDFTLLSSLRKFQCCIHVLANMPYQLCWEPYFKMIRIFTSLTIYIFDYLRKRRWTSLIWLSCYLKRKPHLDHCCAYIFEFITRQNYCKKCASVFGFNPKQIMLDTPMLELPP